MSQAFSFSSRISGTQQLENKLQELQGAVRKSMIDGLKLAAIQIHESAIKGIREPSQGRRYGNHIASKPGDPPNTDTGRLINSIKWEIDEQSLSSVVGTNLDYGLHLEFGTTKMGARPWLAPALRANMATIARLFKLGGSR